MYSVMTVVAVGVVVVGKSFAGGYFECCCLYEIDCHYLNTVVELEMNSILVDYSPNAVFGADFLANLQREKTGDE